ncbi:MAG: hypothetical protein ACJAYU_005233 [Bradymonadia bacterium]|jgi:hypothetical protein
MKAPTLLFAVSLVCLASLASAQEATSQPHVSNATQVDASALHGVWEADLAGMLEAVEMTDEEREMAVSFMEGAALQIQFTAAGHVEMRGLMMGQHQVEIGTWTPVSSEGSLLTIDNVMAEGPDAESERLIITFASATSMTATDPDGEMIPFTKLEEFTVSDVPPPIDIADFIAQAPQDDVEYIMPSDWPEDTSPEVAADWLHGTWNARFDVLLAEDDLHPAEQRELARFFADAQMQMIFEPGGVFRLESALLADSRDEVGTWTLTSVSGSTILVTALTGIGTPDEESESLTLEFRTRDAVTIGDSGGDGIPCSRAE